MGLNRSFHVERRAPGKCSTWNDFPHRGLIPTGTSENVPRETSKPRPHVPLPPVYLPPDMSSPLDTVLEQELAAIAGRNRRRSCPEISGPSRSYPCVEGQPVVSFSSNDYLGLCSHPAVVDAAAQAARRGGVGAGASRLVSGDHPEHRTLEASLSAHLGTEAALVFPSGYQANLGLIGALAGPDDLILSDSLNHASLIDGCRLSRARVVVYRHADPKAAATCLQTARDEHTRLPRRIFLVTESVFSMDGDLAPLPELNALCQAEGVHLLVDEAHALGVLGPGGRGVAAAQGITPAALVGTLGKAFGASGGFVAGSRTLRQLLVNRARTFIFATGLPPILAAAARAALDVITSSEGDTLRQALHARIAQLQTLLDRQVPATPILPLILGSEGAALTASSQLRARGLFVQAIRPPTVPEGTSRLRITLSAAHRPEDIDALGIALRAEALLS